MKWWQNNDNDYNDLNLTIKILKTRWNHKKAKKIEDNYNCGIKIE